MIRNQTDILKFLANPASYGMRAESRLPAQAWLLASPQALFTRVGARCAAPSDATAKVVRSQIASRSAPTEWVRIDADEAVGEIVAKVAEAAEAAWKDQRAFSRGAP